MEYFTNIKTVKYEGIDSENAVSFKHYNASQKVAGKTMEDWLPFSMSWWHTLAAGGRDPFGVETALRPWNGKPAEEAARMRVDAGFEFMNKLGINYFCFHDRDIAPEYSSLKETNAALDSIADLTLQQMEKTGKKLLWGTSSLFTNPRYMHGAATSPNADVFAIAAAQTKKTLDITHAMNGRGYVFWGGREGYETLLNTDMKRELDHMAAFLKMAVDYKEKIGFKGMFYLEPKPKEPTKHQYDFDAAACLEFLHHYKLEDHFQLNLEVNHATLAGHTMQHEMQVARNHGKLGSIDLNFGDPLLGWDTDMFLTNVYEATLMMIELIKNGGVTGGLNFDAKVRRGSHTMDDLAYAYIAGMDTIAWGLKVADAIIKDGFYEKFIADRYSSYNSGIGAKIESGKTSLEELADYAMGIADPTLASGSQELLEAKFNQFIWKTK
ncbi:MAG: xylose isomerase [Brevinema sp.]